MASPSGTTLSGTSTEENIMMMDTRKRKRMLSNRESARRSRMRKQKHMDDLMLQLTHLRPENNLILNNINFATHLHLSMESQNSVLRAQISELNHRLEALNDIITTSNVTFSPAAFEIDQGLNYGFDHHMNGWVDDDDNDVLSPWSLVHVVNHPIMYAFS